MVQHVATTKLVSPPRGGTCLEIIPLHVQILFVHVHITIIEHVGSSDNFVRKQVEHVDPSFTILDSGIGPLKFLHVTSPLTPH